MDNCPSLAGGMVDGVNRIHFMTFSCPRPLYALTALACHQAQSPPRREVSLTVHFCALLRPVSTKCRLFRPKSERPVCERPGMSPTFRDVVPQMMELTHSQLLGLKKSGLTVFVEPTARKKAFPLVNTRGRIGVVHRE